VVLGLEAAPAVAAIFAASKGTRGKKNRGTAAGKSKDGKRRKTASGIAGESLADGLRVGDLPLVSSWACSASAACAKRGVGSLNPSPGDGGRVWFREEGMFERVG